MTVALTNPTIKNAKPGDVLYDKGVTGLHMRVTSERKAFYLYFRTRAKVQRRPKIGDWPTIGLDAARDIARQWLEVVAAGGDPTLTWQAERQAPTVGDLCDKFLEWSARKRKPRTTKDHRYMIERHIRPRWGKRKATDIRNNDVIEFHQSLHATPVHANRLRAQLSKMFNKAEEWEMRPMHSNPAKRIDLFPERKRKRYMKSDEAVVIFDRLVHYGEEFPASAAFLWLLIYTGARPAEIAAAKPAQRHGDRFELGEHKTQRFGKDRVIYLPAQAVAVLDKLGRTANGTITGIKSPKGLWLKILADVGLYHPELPKGDPRRKPQLRMYDLRHSFASIAISKLKMTLPEVGGLLGHTSAATTQRYAHLLEDEGADRASAIADQIDAMAKGERK
jgi:integrase